MAKRVQPGEGVAAYNQVLLALCGLVSFVSSTIQKLRGVGRRGLGQMGITVFINLTTLLVMAEASIVLWNGSSRGPFGAYIAITVVMWVTSMAGQMDRPLVGLFSWTAIKQRILDLGSIELE